VRPQPDHSTTRSHEPTPAAVTPKGVNDGGPAAVSRSSLDELGLSARAYDRICKVARTIADLDGRPTVTLEDISEGIGYRVLDRPAG
jgi:hypothetical protein